MLIKIEGWYTDNYIEYLRIETLKGNELEAGETPGGLDSQDIE